MPSSYQLWKGTAKRVSLKTLNTLCNKLKTHPAILFDYKPDPEENSVKEQNDDTKMKNNKKFSLKSKYLFSLENGHYPLGQLARQILY